MKKLILILLVLPGFARAEGPLFRQKEATTQQEFENVYQDIRSKGLSPNSSGFKCIDSPTFCVDPTNHIIVISSNTNGNPSFTTTLSTMTGIGATSSTSLRFYSGGSSKLGVISTGVEISSGSLTLIGGNIANAAGNTSISVNPSNGSITLPLQPAFLEHLSTARNDVTGDGTVVTVTYNDEVYDKANNFTASTFTAPVAGKYLLSANLTVEGLATTHTSVDFYIVTTGRNYISTSNLPGLAAVTQVAFSQTVIADMSAGDQAYVQVAVNGTGKTADFSGAASFRNYFSGTLVN